MARAAIIIAGFFNVEAGPSGSLEPTCKCGVKWSIAKSRSMPPRKPTATGSHAGTGPPSDASRAGVMRLHTLAAIITPAAKPRSAFVNRSDMPWRMRNTSAAPRVFPRNGTTKATSTPIRAGFSTAHLPFPKTSLASGPPPARNETGHPNGGRAYRWGCPAFLNMGQPHRVSASHYSA